MVERFQNESEPEQLVKFTWPKSMRIVEETPSVYMVAMDAPRSQCNGAARRDAIIDPKLTSHPVFRAQPTNGTWRG